MITSKNRITRRSVLRGAGGVAIGLPFLDAMLRPGQSHAASTVPLRLLVFSLPGRHAARQVASDGHRDGVRPERHAVAAQPLEGSADVPRRVGHVDHADRCRPSPQPRYGGFADGTQLLPGTFETGSGLASWADGVSVDQEIAARITANLKAQNINLKFPSLEFSSGWSISGRSAGQVSFAADQITYGRPSGTNGATKNPIPPQVNVVSAFTRIWVTGRRAPVRRRRRLTTRRNRFWMPCRRSSRACRQSWAPMTAPSCSSMPT